MQRNGNKLFGIGLIVSLILIFIVSFQQYSYQISTNTQGDLSEAILTLSVRLGLAFIILTLYIIALLRKKTKILKEQKYWLDTLTSNIPGGVQCCQKDEFLTISYLSDGFLSLTGFTRDEIAINFSNQYIKMIYPQDRSLVLSEVLKNLSNIFEIQYRLIRKDGTVIWILNKGQLIESKNNSVELYSVLVDISDLKRTEIALVESQRQLRISNKKYTAIIRQTGFITFDFDFADDTISFCKEYKKKFGYSPPTEDFPNCFLEKNLIHSDDILKFNDFCQRMISGAHNHTDEQRIVNSKGKYILCRIHSTTIYDENAVPVRAVGMITDISPNRQND